jgi:hypothetical protein
MPYADPEQARAAARARYQRNRSKVIAQAAAWAAAHPERKREIAREWARKHGRESYRRNRAVALACAARWKRANPEKVREIKAAWQRRNPEQRRMNEAARRARKAGLVTEKIDALVVFARHCRDRQLHRRPDGRLQRRRDRARPDLRGLPWPT